MAGTNFVGNQYVGTREARGAVWLTAHGSDEIASVSTGTFPADNGTDSNLMRQIVEGTVLAKRDDLGLHYPMAADAAQSAVVAANVIPVADPLQFVVGQLVELPVAVAADSDRFRLVTAVDYETSEITVDGATFSLSEGDLIEVDPSRSSDLADGAVAASTTVTIFNPDRFAIGDLLEFSGDGPELITNIVGNDLTVANAITIADASRIVSNPDGNYKISFKTVTIDEFRYTPQNVLVPTRPIGRVKEILVVGLTATAKAALESRIIFDQRTIA